MSRWRIIAGSLFVIILGAASAHADNKSIQGTLLGLDGKPMAGQQIKAERIDVKADPATTKTDARGQYLFKGLPPGAYAIIAYVKNVAKMRAMVKTRSDGWAKVDFDLRTPREGPHIKKKWVWVKGEPGSYTGGHWVEVDQAITPGTTPTDNADAREAARIQQGIKMNTNATMPGR